MNIFGVMFNPFMFVSGLINLGAAGWAGWQSGDVRLAVVYGMWGVGNIIMATKA